MKWTKRHRNAAIGMLIGTLIGIPLWLFTANIFYLILMILLGLIIAVFCKTAPVVPPTESRQP